MTAVEQITRLAARGDGVTDSGRFVPGTAPGDTIVAGKIQAGPRRASPPCCHFAVDQSRGCGGCQLQHVDDDAYRQFVVDRISGALAEQRIAMPALDPVHLSPPHSRRRASLRAERRGRQVVLGFNAGQSHKIIDLRECHVLLPELFAVIAPLRRMLGTVLPDRGRATVVLTRAHQGVDLLLSGFEVDGLLATEALNDFACTHRLARLSIDEGFGPSPRWCPQPPTVTIGKVAVALPEASFLQATADGEATLVNAVRRATDDAACVFDLFAGLGTFALSLTGQVRAVEGNRDAVLALAATHRVTVEHRDLFRRPLDRQELSTADAVVLDPPRAGAREQVAQLAGSPVERLAYVSCNPSTFARDARTLIDGGYTLERITPVGQFRWSTHVELAAAFARQ